MNWDAIGAVAWRKDGLGEGWCAVSVFGSSCGNIYIGWVFTVRLNKKIKKLAGVEHCGCPKCSCVE